MKKVCKLAFAKCAVTLFFLLWIVFQPIMDTDNSIYSMLFLLFDIGWFESFANLDAIGVFMLIFFAIAVIIWLVMFIAVIKNFVIAYKYNKNPENAKAEKVIGMCKFGGLIALMIFYLASFFTLVIALLFDINNMGLDVIFNYISYIILIGTLIASIVLGVLAKRAYKKEFATEYAEFKEKQK